MAKLQNTNQTQPGQSGYLNGTGNESEMVNCVKNGRTEGLDDIQNGEVGNEPIGRDPISNAVVDIDRRKPLVEFGSISRIIWS